MPIAAELRAVIHRNLSGADKMVMQIRPEFTAEELAKLWLIYSVEDHSLESYTDAVQLLESVKTGDILDRLRLSLLTLTMDVLRDAEPCGVAAATKILEDKFGMTGGPEP